MLNLDKRPCTIGNSINGRTQMHGEDPVPYLDVTVSTLISASELNDLMGEPHTADAWFDSGSAKQPEPLHKHLSPYKLKGKFENSAAVFLVGLKLERIELPSITIASCAFEPQLGGMTELKCKLQTPATPKTTKLLLWMARDADVELQFGELEAADTQGELGLEMAESPPTGPDDGEDDEAEETKAAKPKRKPKPVKRPPPGKRKSSNGHARI